MKKIMALVIATAMVLGMAIPAMAATLTVQNTVPGYTFEAYQIFAGAASTDTEADQNGNANPLQLNGVTWGTAIPEASRASFIADLKTAGIIPSDTGSTASEVAVAIHTSNIVNDSDKAQQLAEIAKKYAENRTGVAVSVAEGATTAVFNNLAHGYYLIVNTAKPANETDDAGNIIKSYEMSDLIMEIVGDAVVNSKASDTPQVTKKIDNGATPGAIDSTDVDENTASIGDVIPYVIEGTLPDTYARYKNYYYSFEDTLDTGLTYLDADDASTTDVTETPIKVYIVNGTTAVDVTSKVTGTVGSITASTSSQDIKVTLNDLKAFDTSDDTITITKDTKIRVVYYAKVNEYASVVYTDPNTNTVKVKYSNDPNKNGTGEPGTTDNPVGETPEDHVDSYVTDIRIKKTDGTERTLEGAEFSITGDGVKTVVTTGVKFVAAADGTYYKLADGSYTETAPTEETSAKYDATDYAAGTKYKKTAFTDTAITDTDEVDVTGFVGSDGLLNFKGLNTGVYTITELTAPTGYNPLEDPIYVNVTFDATTKKFTAVACDSSGTALTGDAAVTYNVDDNGVIEIIVENQSGANLPSTGGIGTTIFYAVGAVLVLGAAILLVSKRRAA